MWSEKFRDRGCLFCDPAGVVIPGTDLPLSSATPLGSWSTGQDLNIYRDTGSIVQRSSQSESV